MIIIYIIIASERTQQMYSFVDLLPVHNTMSVKILIYVIIPLHGELKNDLYRDSIESGSGSGAHSKHTLKNVRDIQYTSKA